MAAAVWLDWGKYGISARTFWSVRAQRMVYLSGNMEEAFAY